MLLCCGHLDKHTLNEIIYSGTNNLLFGTRSHIKKCVHMFITNIRKKTKSEFLNEFFIDEKLLLKLFIY